MLTDARMIVRTAVFADAEAIARIHVATWRAAYRGILPDETLAALSEDTRARQWREWLGDQSRGIVVLVAEIDAAVAGFASLGPSRDDDAALGAWEIHAIYIDFPHWRAGLGRDLVARAVETSRTKGATRLTLWVLARNDAACRFYEAVGFALDGALKVDHIGPTEVVELRYGITL